MHEMSNSVFLRKIRKNINLLSAEFAHVKVATFTGTGKSNTLKTQIADSYMYR